MTTPTVRKKWRPPLILVLGGGLLAVIAVALLGLLLLPVLVSMFGWVPAVVSVTAAFLAAVAIVGWLVTRLLLRPVHALVDRVDAARAGQPIGREPLAHYGTVELGAMGEAVLDMATKLGTRAQELEAYSAHVTHELRSPLTSLKAATEMLGDPELDPQTRNRLLGTIAEAADRMEVLLSALRSLAQATASVDAPQTGTTDLTALVREAGARHGISVVCPAKLEVPLPHQAAAAVVDHLVQNAAQHGATRIWIDGDETTVILRDDGPGITPGNRDRVFEPFFTTRRETGGTGMGLAITARLLNAHNARITLGNSKKGTEFLIDFR